MRAWITRNVVAPSRASLRRSLRAQRKMLAWQVGQIRLAEAQFLALQELQRISVSVTVDAMVRLQERIMDRLDDGDAPA